MIGFNALGRMGRLCNQMFQYASLKGIARNVGVDIIIPYHENAVDDGIGNMLRTELFDSFDLNVRTGFLNNVTTIQERFFHFDEELFNGCSDNVNLQGFFQTEKYFKHIEDEIRDDFIFHSEISNPCREMVEGVENPIALHVRRTDYVRNDCNHNVLSLEYYDEALKHFDDDRNVIVFSDEPAWCKQQDLFSNDRFIVSESDDNRVDLCLMTMCDDYIIANSSYSWWGAWLSQNPDSQVIVPKNWFGSEGYTKNHNTQDIIPDRWIKI